MKWSWRIGKLAGVDLYVHATFLLIIGWVGLSAWLQTRTTEAVLASIGFTLALFLCVILHEYGHALTARRYGIKTRDITLLPIGGLARLERMPDKPMQEFWVAVAGPAVNLVLAALLGVVLVGIGSGMSLGALSTTDGGFLERLLAVNVFLLAFNLIPAFPMDGGRVLRALLATAPRVHSGHLPGRQPGAGDRPAVRPHRAVQQPVPGLHRLVRLDRRSAGSEHGPDAFSAGRDPGQPGDADAV